LIPKIFKQIIKSFWYLLWALWCWSINFSNSRAVWSQNVSWHIKESFNWTRTAGYREKFKRHFVNNRKEMFIWPPKFATVKLLIVLNGMAWLCSGFFWFVSYSSTTNCFARFSTSSFPSSVSAVLSSQNSLKVGSRNFAIRYVLSNKCRLVFFDWGFSTSSIIPINTNTELF
jgi:hypothetical protein